MTQPTKSRVCTRCVMDTSAPDISFDADGRCSYCTEFAARLSQTLALIADRRAHADEFIARVKGAAAGRRYNCIVGVSGGVDSSYALYLAVRHGLRPLAVHLDNGWNSELAVHNISSLVNKLGVDLYTHVIDWEENRDLQLSFFKAGVIDIELLMDSAMLALNYQQASKNGLRYILAGTNIATEGMQMPPGWNWLKYDDRNVRDIQKRFGTLPIKTHLLISTLSFVYYQLVRRISWVSFLDYFDYNKSEALATLEREVGYKPYPYKHYESVFTRFYQGYILPTRFGVDKRKLHLSTLIVSGQLTRDEALKRLADAPYPDPAQLEQDKRFVMKKLGFTDETFAEYMASPIVDHAAYRSERWQWDLLRRTYRLVRRR